MSLPEVEVCGEKMPREPLWVACNVCQLKWVAAYMPMEAGKFCELLIGTRCPGCAATSKNIRMYSKEPENVRDTPISS